MGTEITFSCGDFHNFYSQVYETMKVPPPTFKYLKWLSTFLKTHYSNILQYWRRPDLHILFFRKPLLSTWKELAHKCDKSSRHLLFWLPHHFFFLLYQPTSFPSGNILSSAPSSPRGALSFLHQGWVYNQNNQLDHMFLSLGLRDLFNDSHDSKLG